MKNAYDILKERGFIEQTTDEILFSFRSIGISDDLKSKLKQMLILADMAKFAKLIPIPTENEMSLQNAFDFVNETIPIQQPETQNV